MTARWGIWACLLFVLALSAGCRTPQPNLKPAPEPEVLNLPPNSAKYAVPAYPEQAFDNPRDPTHNAFDPKMGMGGGPGGGRGGGGGMGGMGGSMMGTGRGY
ncbi:MAG TPA: hypothetical protein VFE62_25520 [Gemmataceae bacterium]|nr:hypothetical protein [Gemmataceae bacterium]